MLEVAGVVFGFAGILTVRLVPSTVPIVDVLPQDNVGALFVTLAGFTRKIPVAILILGKA